MAVLYLAVLDGATGPLNVEGLLAAATGALINVLQPLPHSNLVRAAPGLSKNPAASTIPILELARMSEVERRGWNC